jgi:hypothetical protein
MPGSPQWSLSLRFPHQNTIHASLLPIRATCLAHLILLDFITRTILTVYEIFLKKYCGAGQTTDDNLLHERFMLGTLGYKHTLIACNTCYFSTATMVTRTRLTVTVYVHCPSCSI